jgi:hypothetical protein
MAIVTLKMKLEIDDEKDEKAILEEIENAVMSIDGVRAAPADPSVKKTYVEEMGITAEEMEQKLRRSFYDSCVVTLIQDLLMRSGDEAPQIRETLIRIWSSTTLRQHEEGCRMMLDMPEEERGAFDPDVQERYLVSMVEEIGSEFRSIFSSPIAFKRPKEPGDDQ